MAVSVLTLDTFPLGRCAGRTILRRAGAGATLAGMNTLAEVEAAVPQLSAEELAELERFVRNARLTKTKVGGRSALDLRGRQPRSGGGSGLANRQ